MAYTLACRSGTGEGQNDGIFEWNQEQMDQRKITVSLRAGDGCV